MQTLTRPFTESPLNGVPPRVAARNEAALPLALKLIAVTTFLPEELSFYILGLRLTAIRLILIVLTPLLLIRLGQRLAAGRYRFVLSDLFVFLAGFWMIYAPANVVGVGQALNHAGPTALEFCVGYMATRILLSEHGHALSFAALLCRIIAIVALLALLDPLTNRSLMHDLASQLTGYQKPLVTVDIRFRSACCYRLGLLRATGPIEHAILFGFACAIGLLIAVSIPIRSRSFAIVACSLGAIFAFSSAPLQGILLGFALLIYNRIMAGFSLRWPALISLGAAGVMTLFLVSDAPVSLMIRHLIYDPESGYYRMYVWTMAGTAVAQSPWVGLGFGPYVDPDVGHSVDSLWLMAAMQFGIPGSVLIALSMIGAASLPTSGRAVNLTPAESTLGTTLGILIFLTLFLAFTVDLWGTTWILSGLLIGVRAHLGELGRVGRRRLTASKSG